MTRAVEDPALVRELAALVADLRAGGWERLGLPGPLDPRPSGSMSNLWWLHACRAPDDRPADAEYARGRVWVAGGVTWDAAAVALASLAATRLGLDLPERLAAAASTRSTSLPRRWSGGSLSRAGRGPGATAGRFAWAR